MLAIAFQNSFYTFINIDVLLPRGRDSIWIHGNSCITEGRLEAVWTAFPAIYLLYCLQPKCYIVNGAKIKWQYSLFHNLPWQSIKCTCPLCLQKPKKHPSLLPVNWLKHQTGSDLKNAGGIFYWVLPLFGKAVTLIFMIKTCNSHQQVPW